MRTSFIIALLLIVLLTVAMIGCKSDDSAIVDNPPPEKGQSTITGLVYDAGQRVPIAGVNVLAMEPSQDDQTQITDAEGKFQFTFEVDTLQSSTVMLRLRKTGYRDTVITRQIRSANNSMLTIYYASINPVVTPTMPSTGLAQTIAFMGTTAPVLMVYGVGGTETAYMDWEVRDSLGLPIDAAHAVDLHFTIANGPGDGAYVSPSVVRTNAAGQARITVNSGIRAGIMQILASATVNGRTITSAPIRVEIVGGYPDQTHFSMAPEMYNFPALHWLNRRDKVTVLVGDKYSNPAVQSLVYFRTSAGVVQGSLSGSGAVTDKDGLGAAELISGNPLPIGTNATTPRGAGFHYLVARTVGQGGVTVTDSLLLLWSGWATISNVNPMTFDIANGGSQTFTFQVTDEYGNPLAAGTTISVAASIPPPPTEGAQQNKVMLDFGAGGSVNLPDTIERGPGLTDFQFTLTDGSWGIIDTAGTPVNLMISVSGPNVQGGGTIAVTLRGVVH